MKTRNGFVSNSSSSSFIVAVAKVINEKKLKEWLKSLNLSNWQEGYCKIVTLKDIIEEEASYDARKRNDEVII
jgi:hypothetical protein